jgi:hypothetical protein
MPPFSVYTEPTASIPPGPFKHVNYVLKMVLGVDDLEQEFAYHSGHNHWLTHAVLGYGTVNGLRVTLQTAERDGETDIEVVISQGTAISPQGQLIRVDQAQCARLNRWIEANRDDVIAVLDEAPSRVLTLYVVLSYNPCLTDPVVIPGEPCRDEETAQAPSRIMDDFRLSLVFDAPEQTEIDALRTFASWLGQIEWTDDADSDTLRSDFESNLLTFNDGLSSDPPAPAPSPASTIQAPREAAEAYLQQALRLWVTRIRPEWLGTNADASGLPPSEDRILLAQLDIPLTEDLEVTAEGDVVVGEDERPILAQLQLVQYLLMLSRHTVAASGDGSPPPPPPPPAPTFIIAAGRFGIDGEVRFRHGGLEAVRISQTLFYLVFDDFEAEGHFVVKGTPFVFHDNPSHTFEEIIVNDNITERLREIVREQMPQESRERLAERLGVDPDDVETTIINPDEPRGIMVRMQSVEGEPPATGFAVEISQFEG